MKLTDKEKQAMVKARESSGGNGDDFGFVDELGFTGKQLSGICSTLENKGLISLFAPEKVNGEYWMQQFELHESLKDKDTEEEFFAAIEAL